MAVPPPSASASPEEAIRLLTVALRNLAMYTHEHPAFQRTLEALGQTLHALLKERARLAIQVLRDQVIVDQRVLPLNQMTQGFASYLLARGIKGITVAGGVTREELVASLDILARRPQEVSGGFSYEELLRSKGVQRIWIHPFRATPLDEEQPLGEMILQRLFRGQPLGAQGRDALADFLLQDPKGMGGAISSLAVSTGVGDAERASWISERLLNILEQLLAGHPEDWERIKDRLSQLVVGLEIQAQLEFFHQSLGREGASKDWARGLAEAYPREALAELVAEEFISPREATEKAQFFQELVPDPAKRGELQPEVEKKLSEYGVSKEEFLRTLREEEPTVEERLSRFLQGPRAEPGDYSAAPSLAQSLSEEGRKEEALRVVNRFFNALNHPEWAVRKEVAASVVPMLEIMERIGGGGDKALKVREFVLRKMLTEPDKEVFRLLSEGLERLARDLLEQGEADQPTEFLQKIDSALGKSDLGPEYVAARREGILKCLTQEAFLDKQIEALGRGKEPDAQRALQAIRIVGDVGIRRIIESLGEVRQVSRRIRLFRVLKELGGAAVEPLKKSLQDPRWYLVRNAVMVLAEIRDTGSVPQLVALLSHPEPRVRKEVVRALRNLASPKAVEGMIKALEDEDEAVRLKAVDGLQTVGGAPGKERLRQFAVGTALRGPKDSAIRLRAVRALGASGDEEDVRVLVSLLARKGLFSKMESEEIRRAAVVALVGIVERTGSERAFRGLVGTVPSDPSEEIRKIAEQCIAAHQTALMKTQPL